MLFAAFNKVYFGLVLATYVLLPDAIAALIFSSTSALAQCPPTAEMHQALTGTEYREVVVGRGIEEGGNPVTLYFNRASGTYTFVRTTPEDEACVVSAGDVWEFMDDVLSEDGSAETAETLFDAEAFTRKIQCNLVWTGDYRGICDGEGARAPRPPSSPISAVRDMRKPAF